jgi:hypothetical protein
LILELIDDGEEFVRGQSIFCRLLQLANPPLDIRTDPNPARGTVAVQSDEEFFRIDMHVQVRARAGSDEIRMWSSIGMHIRKFASVEHTP